MSANLDIPNLPGVSLVAYYHHKPTQLSELIKQLQQQLKKLCGENFSPYDLEQVHGTIIGCEGLKTKAGIINRWFYQYRNEVRYVDYGGFIDHLLHTRLMPLKIGFGGYRSQVDYQFLSRGQHPGDRSFQLQKLSDQKFIPVLIGWPIVEQTITTSLDQLRQNLQQFNLLHKYYQRPQDIDNDFYMRLGTINSQLNLADIAKINQFIGSYLQQIPPILITLSHLNLALIKYRDLALSPASTKFYPLNNLNLTTNFIESLYY